MRPSLRSWLWRVPLEQEVDEELALHIELRTRELVARGMAPGTAREVATRRLGDVRRLKRTCVDLGRKRDREMRLTQWLEELGSDVKFALRQLRRSPSFTAVAALTLALGIGANSAIFALADAVLIRPLPFGEPDRLVMLWDEQVASRRNTVTPLDFVDWAEQNRTFDAMAAIVQNGATMIGADGTPELVANQTVTPELFDVLGVRAIAGRTFVRSDITDEPNAVVVSERFWKNRFGGDPALVGRDIRVGVRSLTVIGIVPAEFQILGASEFWDLLPPFRANVKERNLHLLRVIGRLAPGTTLEAARIDMTRIADEIAQTHPASNKGHGVYLEPLREALIGPELRLTSMLFLGVVGFVLLTCCANVANLLLARTNARARELAVRAALGAGRRRILAQLLTESVVLSALGGLLGVGVGAAILAIAPSLIPRDLLPTVVTLTFDARVVVFCVVTAFLVGVVFGLAPAWQATGTSLVHVIATDSRTATGRGGRFRGGLVAAEVAAAVLLLCGAGLLLRTLIALESVDPGFRAERVLTMSVNIPGAAPALRYWSADSRRRFFEDVEREVTALPGVRTAGWGTSLPLDGSGVIGSMTFEIPGDPTPQEATRPQALYQIVSPTYFQALGIPLVAGRGFTDGDSDVSVPICIVNEAFARQYLSGRDPLGMAVAVRPMVFGPAAPVTRQIVGVIRQVRTLAYEPETPAQIYVPMAQNPWIVARLVVQAEAGSAAALVPAVRAAIARVDKDRAVTLIRTMDDVSREATARQRFRAVLVVTFAGLALVLAMVGVFGVLAYSVQQRTREFGVRVALGASAADVLRLVVASAARVTGIGAAIGLVAAGVFSRWIATLLFGVQPLDPVTFASVAVLLGVTAAIATAVPALRAARVDPAVTFRHD